MLPACLHSGVLCYTNPDRMFLPNLDLTDGRQESVRDHWVQQQMKEAMRHLPTDLEVLPSPLLLMEREAVQRSSPPAPLVAHPDLAEKPTSSSRRKKRRRGAPSCFSASEKVGPMPVDVWAAAINPVSSSATALSAWLASPLPKPSSHSPAQDSVAKPDELEECLRFYARQIKSFRRASLLYSSPELTAKDREMEEDYRTAVRQFYCRPPPSSPCFQSCAAAEQPTPGLQSPAAAEQPMPSLQSLSPGLQGATTEQSTTGLDSSAVAIPSLPQPPPHAAEDVKRGMPRLKSSGVPATPQLKSSGVPATVIGDPSDASALAQATEGLADASAPAQATEGLGDPLAPAPGLKAFQGFSERLVLVLVPEPCDEGFEDELPSEPVPKPFKDEPPPDSVPEWSEEKLVLILASEPRDEGFEEETPPDPVSERFKEQLVLVLASKGSPGSVPVSEGPVRAASASEGPASSVPVSEGSPGSASASEGSPGSASASEGSPGSASASEGSPGSASASEGLPGTVRPKPDSKPDSNPPEFHRVSGGSSTLRGRPPDLPSRGSSTLLPPDAAKVSTSLLASLSSLSPAAKVSTSLLASLSSPLSPAAKVSTSLPVSRSSSSPSSPLLVCTSSPTLPADLVLQHWPVRGDVLVDRLTFVPIGATS
ncbi:hypothetical protein CRENBAI_007950 [Crenichthys baileyi]|uniref:Uncharacterized protein n=1 Tax=Crenichthys baileyi TaxID=28760 RepID=A0AAV9R3B4_9TELE